LYVRAPPGARFRLDIARLDQCDGRQREQEIAIHNYQGRF
jgi:hypothetical protein